MAFVLRVMGSHWRFVSPKVAGSDLYFEKIFLTAVFSSDGAMAGAKAGRPGVCKEGALTVSWGRRMFHTQVGAAHNVNKLHRHKEACIYNLKKNVPGHVCVFTSQAGQAPPPSQPVATADSVFEQSTSCTGRPQAWATAPNY